MKKEYLKWVTKWMSADYKPKMRAGIGTLYDPAADETGDCVSSTWWLESNTEEEKSQLMEEETLMLILECMERGWKFGDARKEV